MESPLLSPGSWCMWDFFCALHERSLFPQVLRKSYNQTPLAFKVRFPGDSQSLCLIPKLGNLTWGSEPSKQQENCFGIIALQFVGHPSIGYGIWFYCDWSLLLSHYSFFFVFEYGVSFLVGSSVLLSIVVEQLVVIISWVFLGEPICRVGIESQT